MVVLKLNLTTMIEIKETGNGKWGLFVRGLLIGESKAHYDAELYRGVLTNLVEETYNKGYADGERRIKFKVSESWTRQTEL